MLSALSSGTTHAPSMKPHSKASQRVPAGVTLGRQFTVGAEPEPAVSIAGPRSYQMARRQGLTGVMDGLAGLQVHFGIEQTGGGCVAVRAPDRSDPDRTHVVVHEGDFCENTNSIARRAEGEEPVPQRDVGNAEQVAAHLVGRGPTT